MKTTYTIQSIKFRVFSILEESEKIYIGQLTSNLNNL